MDRDGRQGWSRRAEEAWVRVFRPGPKVVDLTKPNMTPPLHEPPRTVAFPDRAERLIVEGFASTRVDTESDA